MLERGRFPLVTVGRTEVFVGPTESHPEHPAACNQGRASFNALVGRKRVALVRANINQLLCLRPGRRLCKCSHPKERSADQTVTLIACPKIMLRQNSEPSSRRPDPC